MEDTYTSSPLEYEHTPLQFADSSDMSTYGYDQTSSGSSSSPSMVSHPRYTITPYNNVDRAPSITSPVSKLQTMRTIHSSWELLKSSTHDLQTSSNSQTSPRDIMLTEEECAQHRRETRRPCQVCTW